MAEGILEESYRRAKQETRRSVAAAHAEINRHKQREIDQFRPCAIFVQEGLQKDREKYTTDNRPAIKPVHLDL